MNLEITRLQPQKRKKGRFNLFNNGRMDSSPRFLMRPS